MTLTLCHRGVPDCSFGVWEENDRISFYNLFLHYCFKRFILCMFYYVHNITVEQYVHITYKHTYTLQRIEYIRVMGTCSKLFTKSPNMLRSEH